MNRTLAMATALGAAAFGLSAPARAADTPLPSFLTAPSPSALVPAGGSVAVAAPLSEPESIYHGLYVGTEVFGVGGHGVRGGIGGDVYAGYERLLGNGLLVDVQGGAGHGPALWGGAGHGPALWGGAGHGPALWGGPGLKGWTFGEANAAVGYPMGRVTPFITTGLVVARSVTGGGLAEKGATGDINDLMNDGGNLYAATRVGAGFTYALTPNTALTFDVQVGRGLALGLP